jgi:NAD(P)H-hydrate epimerase
MSAPVLTVIQMRQWEEATWRTGQTEEAVMRQAGRAVAQVAERMTKPDQHVLVLAGKGHNGDDAVFAAEALRRSSNVIRVSDPETGLREFEAAFARKPALVIDGLFGIGLNRPLADPWPKFLERINSSNVPVLAVDVPSGLNADTGLPMPEAVQADTTLTLGAIKGGLIKPSAWPFVGRLEVGEELGLVPCPFHSELNFTSESDFANFPPRRPVAGHKGTFGHVAIVAGSLGYHGAAVLASRGAQRAQPGLVTVLTSPETYVPIASQCQAVMVRPFADPFQLPDTCTALLAGPGLAAPDLPAYVREFSARTWREMDVPLIIDASALAWLPPGTVTASASRVITPHPGEAARLLAVSSADVQNDRPGALRRLSQQFGDAIVVLKGHQTLVGRSKGPIFINSTGNPFLGQGGTGDLLAGYIAGLLAQPALQRDALLTTRFAVWRHGAAADALSIHGTGWVVEELVSEVGAKR